LVDNLVENNDANGFTVEIEADPDVEPREADRNVLSGNRIHENARDGIQVLNDATNTQVREHLATDNRRDGIDINAPGTTVASNGAFSNDELGIEGVAGIIDAGRNRAALNDPPQCTFVRCGPAPRNGSERDDFIVGTSGNDIIDCGEGDDVVYAGVGNDIIRCAGGDDTVHGGPGNDILYGEAGADRLFERAGATCLRRATRCGATIWPRRLGCRHLQLGPRGRAKRLRVAVWARQDSASVCDGSRGLDSMADVDPASVRATASRVVVASIQATIRGGIAHEDQLAEPAGKRRRPRSLSTRPLLRPDRIGSRNGPC
jgi:hypothetical protein